MSGSLAGGFFNTQHSTLNTQLAWDMKALLKLIVTSATYRQSSHVTPLHMERDARNRLLARYPHDVLVYGHTHRQFVTRAEGRLVVNPGAAGKRRFANTTPSVARLTIADGVADVEIVLLGNSA